MRIGTWLTRVALSDPIDTAKALADAGISHGSIMLNDYGGARAPRPFTTHDTDKIVALAEALRDQKIGVSLTTWVMPHREFIDGLLAIVPDLADRCGASMLVLDAEEPWTKAIDPMDRGEAAYLLSTLVQTKCLSGIANVNAPMLEPLAEICSVWSPQAYATRNPKSLPADRAVDHALTKWRSAFGEPARWMIGLACYDQPVPASTLMQPCLDRAASAGIVDVCYWSHRRILERPDVAAVLSGASEPSTPPAQGGIMPELDVEAMPSDVVVDHVGQLQGLLSWASRSLDDPSIDPGKVDGRPGPKTQAALDAFNVRSQTRAPVGVATGQTWWALLR